MAAAVLVGRGGLDAEHAEGYLANALVLVLTEADPVSVRRLDVALAKGEMGHAITRLGLDGVGRLDVGPAAELLRNGRSDRDSQRREAGLRW